MTAQRLSTTIVHCVDPPIGGTFSLHRLTAPSNLWSLALRSTLYTAYTHLHVLNGGVILN